MNNNNVPKGYFTEKTMLRLILNNVIGSNRLILRAVEAMLACKLTLTYGIYHQMMDWRILAMSEETMSYKQAENMADFFNQLVPKHYTAPTELMHTQEESEDETIKKYEEYKSYLDLFEGMAFVPRVVDKFCETVYNADDYYTFKAFCNFNYSIYAEILLLYQMRSIDYQTFTEQFQELKLFSGKREPINGRELKLFIRTMREIVDLYKKIMAEISALSDFPL